MSLQVSNVESLVGAIADAHARLQTQATKAVNMALTLHNWLIGGYIALFELQEADRAAYGEKLLTELARELVRHRVSSTGRRQLYNYLSFYRAYPQIVRTLSAQCRALVPDILMRSDIVLTASAPIGVSAEQLLNHLWLKPGKKPALATGVQTPWFAAGCLLSVGTPGQGGDAPLPRSADG